LTPVLVVAALAAGTTARAARADSVPWCGNDTTAADRQPDAVQAFEWHVVYAYPADGQDRFAFYAPHIVGDVAAITNWWTGQDGTRQPRFDLFDFPGCGSTFGKLDISHVQLPERGEVYAAGGFDRIEADIKSRGLVSDEKYALVYYDGPFHSADEFGVCGDGADGVGVVYVETCTQSAGDDVRQVVAAYEIVHNLGALPDDFNGAGPPHRCPDSPGNPCDSPNDILAPQIQDGATLGKLQLDVGHDDYYGHSGSWWDVQDSPFLEHLDSSDHSPPSPIAGLTATSVAGSALFDWNESSDASTVFYRLYGADGSLLDRRTSTNYTIAGAPGSIVSLTVQAEDSLGHLSAPTTLRFKVGYGIVDANGTLVRDTVPPSDLGRLKVRRAGKQVIVSWAAATDTVGVRGYRVTLGGKVYRTVSATSIKLPLAAPAAARSRSSRSTRPGTRAARRAPSSPSASERAAPGSRRRV
jgi:hypothetical protein